MPFFPGTYLWSPQSGSVDNCYVQQSASASASAKGQLISKQNCRAITSPKKRTELTIQSNESTQDSEFRLFFGRSYGSTIFVLRLTDL